MTTQSNSVRRIPEGYHTVTPFVIVKDSMKFTSFMQAAFDAVELFPPVVGEDGSVGHAEVRIGDSIVMMFDKKPEWPDTFSYLRLYVDDCKTVYEKALQAGASSLTKPTHVPWGDMVARVMDPLGNIWGIQTRIEDVDEEELNRRAEQQEFIDAMNYIQSAELFPRA